MNNEGITSRRVRSSSTSYGSSPTSNTLQSRRPSYRPVQSQPPPLTEYANLQSNSPPITSNNTRRGSKSTNSSKGFSNLVYIIIAGSICLFITCFFVFQTRSNRHVKVASKDYEFQPYQHLDFSKPTSIEAGTRVFHVTKEFGPATMGGLGSMLTALAISQSESPSISISVILPHYSFLKKAYPSAKLVVDLPVPIHHGSKTELVGCKVHLLKWKYSTMIDFLNPNLEVDESRDIKTIDIYLIGPGSRAPFDIAFRATDAGDIYTAYKPLKQEWKDLWFAKSSANLISFLNTATSSTNPQILDEEVKTALNGKKALIDVVHLHGATNAMVGFFLRQAEDYEKSHALPPTIIYSLHDSLDEVEYSNLVSNVVTFLDPLLPGESSIAAPINILETYIHGKQLFTSALGIDLGNMVTFVSRSIATDIVEGRFKFSLHDLVMPSISHRAKTGSFIGVTNGLDFTERSKNPFMSQSLIENSLNFPRIGSDLLSEDTFWTSEPFIATIEHPTNSNLSAISFVHAKERAKLHLIQSLPELFKPEDLDRPFFLFIGRFQYNKGCQFFLPLLNQISNPSSPLFDARLILLGAPNNFPITLLQTLVRQFPNHLTLIQTLSFQQKWGTTIRMASDFSFVPSFSEAFGLVAVEGLAFGMRVVSTGVGGLSEFLVPILDNDTAIESVVVTKEGEAVVKDKTVIEVKEGNSHLFSLKTKGDSLIDSNDYSISAEYSRPSEAKLRPAIESCLKSVREAIFSWRKLKEGDWIVREKVVRRLVKTALDLKWNREKGPVEEYSRVYDIAIKDQRRRILAIPVEPRSSHLPSIPPPPKPDDAVDSTKGSIPPPPPPPPSTEGKKKVVKKVVDLPPRPGFDEKKEDDKGESKRTRKKNRVSGKEN